VAENYSFEVKVTSEKHTGSMNAELDWQLSPLTDRSHAMKNYSRLKRLSKKTAAGSFWGQLG